jgi:hypothetical protein
VPVSEFLTSVEENASRYSFLECLDEWIQSGREQYGVLSVNRSVSAGIVVGTGEEYESIQDAFDAGYSCLYLKNQRFNVTEPIVPPKEDIYVIADGAETIATEPMSALFDIRNVRYAHFDGVFINGNGLAQKCIDAMHAPSYVPAHQILNCKIWGACFANVDLTGCEDSFIFNSWIDGRKTNDTPDAITEYGVKVGEPGDDYKTEGQINLIHVLMGFHRKADVWAKNIAQLKLANSLLSSKTSWSQELEVNLIAEGGTGEDALLPTIELISLWMENALGGDAPNILIRNRMISKLTILGGVFYTDWSPDICSGLNPSAETITLVGALFENSPHCESYNIEAATVELVSIGCSYNWKGIDTGKVTACLFFGRNTSTN